MFNVHVRLYKTRRILTFTAMTSMCLAMFVIISVVFHANTISAQEKVAYEPQYRSAIGPSAYTTVTTEKNTTYNLVEPELIGDDIFEQGVCPSSKSSISGSKLLAPINKKESVGDYVPPNLVEIEEKIKTRGSKTVCLEETTAHYLLNMFSDAKDEGYAFEVTSGYRSPSAQLSLYNKAIAASGFKGTLRVAPPYHSEHHLNAVDISTAEVSEKGIPLSQTTAGKWLAKNAYKYGFVMSYPKGKEYITGYQNEDWHWKFVGIENAELIANSGLTFHEIVTSPSTRIITKAEAQKKVATVQIQNLNLKPLSNPSTPKPIIEIGG